MNMDQINEKMHMAMDQTLDQILNDPNADRDSLCTQFETMYKARTEFEKVAQAAREHETQVREHRKDVLITSSVQVGLTAAGWAVYNALFTKGLHFEEFGTVASHMLKNLTSNFKSLISKK